jgi:periplasmic protein TonB
MSYQALLFCPDEKTARVVSQVLSELEFTVEPCNEPFAAVKKLMVQHFDAIVVDCDNEQNAALLFKSARNSGSNQTSLSVAVVEGQAGVAKAFRLGANLVLTKPIHVEQSKGTLRVARGLLRKGQASKPLATVSMFPEPVAPPSLPPPVPFPTSRAAAPPPTASASFDLDAEPTPQPDTVDAALLEYMPDSALSSAENSPQSSAESTQSKQYAWQPHSKPMAEPMASALRRAAEAAGKTGFDNSPAGHTAGQPSGSGAAAAPARAREVPTSKVAPPVVPEEVKPSVATLPPRSVEKESRREAAVTEIFPSSSIAQTAQAPSFSSLDDSAQQASGAGGGKKTLVVALILLGVAAAGYFGWSKMQSQHSQPLTRAVAPAETGSASLPPNPTPSAEVQPTGAEAATQPSEQPQTATGLVTSSKPSAAVVAEVPGQKTATPAKAQGDVNDVASVKTPAVIKTEPSQALVVKNELSAQPKADIAAQESEQAPDLNSVPAGTDTAALSGLVNTNAVNATKAPQQTLRISQGVSQGLILKKVQPTYPEQARQMRLEGKVELQANISKTGSITGIKQISGDATLGRAAVEAVRQWKYKPYYLSGEPVEIQTQITVNFKLP